MGGNNKAKSAKGKRKSDGHDAPPNTGKKQTKKAKMADKSARQPLPQHSNFYSQPNGDQSVANCDQIEENSQVTGPERTVVRSQTDHDNNNAIPASEQQSRSRPHSQDSMQRQKLRELRDTLKAKASQNDKGQRQLTDYGDGGEGCSYQEAPQAIEVIEGRRILRSTQNSTRNVIKNPENVGQSREKFSDRTEVVDSAETHGRVPDGVSLDVSDDDYREENNEFDNVSEHEEASHDEGAASESDQESGSEGRPVQSSSDSEGESSSSSSSSSSEDEPEFDRAKLKKKFKRDPNYKMVLESLVAQKMRKKKARRRRLRKEKKERRRKRKGMTVTVESNVTPKGAPRAIPARYLSPIVKSPSDSTLYTPALKLLKRHEREQEGVVLKGPVNDDASDEVMEKISNFVDSMRIESARKNKTDRKRHRSEDDDEQSSRRPERGDDPREVTDRIILESEKFKANLVAPKGMPDRIDSNIELLRKLDNDDDFFHTSCHIEPALRLKVERGEFIDLEKLLPNERAAGGVPVSQDNRLGLVYEDGEAFLAPAKKVNKINSIRRWDAAFRVYATIFSEANPHRASELLQYVQVIHLAAANNAWENVAFYDYTFRQLMATKPWRSWAKTYTQGWNIAFTNANKNFNHANGNAPNSSYNNNSMSRGKGGNNSVSSASSGSSGNWKDDCCWKYNKNQCKRSSNECRYNHRCTFCAGWNHSKANCRKR